MKGNKKRGIGLSFALNGLKIAVLTERNLRIHLIAAIIVLGVSAYTQLSLVEWTVILLTIFFVIGMELINSVVERVIDYVKPEIHPEAKIIKDMAASAVFIAALMSVIIGCIIFIPKLF